MKTSAMSAPAAIPNPARIHVASLLLAIVLMVLVTVWPPLLTGPDGKADHTLALLLCAAMSTGFVHGVGFVPRRLLWRVLFSGWVCLLWLAAALARLQGWM